MADRLRQIEAFLCVAETRNFTRGGERIGLSQPALSALIASFEADIGIKLFNRTTRSVTLTQAGAQFLPHAERIAREVTASIATLKDTAALLRGHVRVAALPSLCSTLIPRSLYRFIRLHPGIEIRVEEALAKTLVERVASGACDFGLGVNVTNAEGIRFQRILQDELALLVRKEDPLALPSVPWQALDARNLIATSPTTSVRRAIDKALAGQDISPIITHEVEFMSTAIGFVRAGLGVTILPTTALADFDRTDIATVRLTDPVVTRDVGFLQRSDYILSPAARALAKEFAKLTEPPEPLEIAPS